VTPRAWIGRSATASAPWSEALEQAGWEASALPLIRHREFELEEDGVAALGALDRFGWVFFASARGVRLLLRRLSERHGAAFAWPPALRAAAVGPATAAALRAAGVEPALTGDSGGAKLATAFLAAEPDPDQELLLIAASNGRPELRQTLEAAGHPVTVIELYESLACEGPQPAPGEPVLLFSPSGARSLALRVDDPAAHPVWAVGPTTAAAARSLGFAVAGALSRPEPAALHELLPS